MSIDTAELSVFIREEGRVELVDAYVKQENDPV